MSKHDINKAYISPIDKFLHEFDDDHSKSESQILEIAKHERIAYLRDHEKQEDVSVEIWTEF